VDAVILEYHLGLLDGAAVADEIKKVRPRLPIIMLTENLELPEGALKSVDALVTSSDGPHFLLEAIHSVLQAKDCQHFDAASAELATPVEEVMPTPAKRHILVVDDDSGVRETVSMTLTAAGDDVVAAEDGFRALSQLRKKLPDVVLSDLDMPGMSGFELLSVVRRRFPLISTVVCVRSYDRSTALSRASESSELQSCTSLERCPHSFLNLGCFKYLATFQATRFEARRD